MVDDESYPLPRLGSAEFGAAYDDAGHQAHDDARRLVRIVREAEAVVTAAIWRTVQLPFAAVPGAVKAAALTLAKYRLYLRRQVPEDVRLAHKDAQAWLVAVQAGDVSLDPDTAPRRGIRGGVAAPAGVFSGGHAGGYADPFHRI